VDQVKSEKHAISKKRYGKGDVMLWKKQFQGSVSARITTRFSRDEVSWMSGRSKPLFSSRFKGILTITTAVSASTYVSLDSKGGACWFDIFGKQHGHLLDTSSMTAITKLALNDPSPFDPTLGSQQEPRRLTLHIADYKNRQKFTETVEELRRTIANNPSTSKENRASISQPRYVLPTPMA
jgi:hypothetical protein